MSITRKIAYDGEVLVLLLTKPNWTKSPEVEEQCDTDIQAVRKGVEHRRPNRATAVVGRIAYETQLVGDDWQQWRGMQSFIGSRRVVCPIWPDAQKAGKWSSHVHDSPLVVGWDTGFINCKLGTTTSLPDRDYLAPCCIGQLKLNDDEPLCGDMTDIKVEVTYDERISIAAAGVEETTDAEVDAAAASLEITSHTLAASGYWEDAILLSVAASSEPTEADFAWLKDGSAIAGKTRPTLALASLLPDSAGSYTCMVSNGFLTQSCAIPVTFVEHPFSYEGEGKGGMGTYDRYDQHTDYVRTYEWQYWMYLGIGDGSDNYKDGVLAWAKGCAVGLFVPAWESSDGTEVDTACTWYLGCYGAQNCTLRYTNVVGGIGAIYMSFDGHYSQDSDGNWVETRRSKENHLILEGCTLENNGGEWTIPYPIPARDNTGLGHNGGNSVLLSSGTTLQMRNSLSFSDWDSTNWQLSDGTIMRSPVPLGDTFEITGAGTVLGLDYFSSPTQGNSSSLYLWFHKTDAGATFSLNNNSLIRGGRQSYVNSEGVQVNSQTNSLYAHSCWSYDSAADEWSERVPTSSDVAFRFGGGYLALYGDLTGTLQDEYDSWLEYYKWSFSDWSSGREIMPLAVLQVRDVDGTWRAAKADDFTVTYCITDSEGLAATGGRYDGLAGYTIITAGVSI